MQNQLIIPTLPNSSVHISGLARPAKSDFTFPLHIHNEFEVLRMYEGSTQFYVHNKEYTVNEGDIVFVNSRVPHSTSIHKGSRAFFVQFAVDIITDNSEIRPSKYLSRFINYDSESIVIISNDTPANLEISECLEAIRIENFEKKEAYDTFIKSYMYKILAVLYRENIIKSIETFFESENLLKISPVLDYIDAHYNEDITLKKLANLLNINEYYFCRLFKRTVNTSVIQYLNFVRICKAEKMLLSTDKSISEISYETGFSSVSYFNKSFKKQKFCTPSTYRKIKYQSGR